MLFVSLFSRINLFNFFSCNEKELERQNYFLRSQHAPIDVTFPAELPDKTSICLFGKITKHVVIREAGCKYFYFTMKPLGSTNPWLLYFKFYVGNAGEKRKEIKVKFNLYLMKFLWLFCFSFQI